MCDNGKVLNNNSIIMKSTESLRSITALRKKNSTSSSTTTLSIVWVMNFPIKQEQRVLVFSAEREESRVDLN